MEIPDFLYHYTNLESLALILKNRTIRFNQLSQMDDLKEGQSQDPERYREFIFASSWTDNEKEDIPMWRMYSSRFSGIKIKMPVNPFVKERINFPGKPWIVAGKPEGQSQAFFQKVDYLDDDDEQLNPRAFLNIGGGYAHVTPLLGWHKSKAWSFQREWRYLLYFAPADETNTNPQDEFVKATLRFCQKNYLPFTYVDLPFRDDAFLQTEITYSPWFSDGNKELLGCLKEKYAPSMKVEQSELTGTLR